MYRIGFTSMPTFQKKPLTFGSSKANATTPTSSSSASKPDTVPFATQNARAVDKNWTQHFFHQTPNSQRNKALSKETLRPSDLGSH